MKDVLAKVFTPDTTHPLHCDLMQTSEMRCEEKHIVKPGSNLKMILAVLLVPLISFTEILGKRWRPLWAFSWTKSQLPGLDSSVILLGKPELHGTKRISMGLNLYLYRDLYLETRGEGQIYLGNNVVISRGVHIVAYNNVHIGDCSMIGEYTSIRDANHRFGAGLAPRYSGMDARPVHIGKNVWIGRGVTILPGVTIGDGAVIGANAVVTRDVAEFAVMGGVPARNLHQESFA